MNTLTSKRPFHAKSADAAGVVSWVHIGDLHMTKAGEQNHLDLAEIVNEVNQAFADSLSFVFLPGDVADDGSRAAYAVVRGELDRLTVPWCAIIGKRRDSSCGRSAHGTEGRGARSGQCTGGVVGAWASRN